jgi:hypothetical protein
LVKKKIFSCVYYDKTTNSYKKDGVTYKSYTEEGDYYIINCCSKHLTTFNAQIDESIDIRDKTFALNTTFSYLAAFILVLISLV